MKQAFILISLCCLLTSSVHAVKTERWELSTPSAFMRGKLHRLIVTSDGELRLGYGHGKLGEFAKEIWCSTVAPDGTIYFGTGSPADVYALGKDNKVTKLHETEAIAVTALATDSKGNLFAATLAEGRVFKIESGNKAVEFAKLRAPYIWSLVVDNNDNLFAGTGPDGRVYRISPDGKVEEWYVTEESNILSLALNADGALFAGGSDRGLLYRITGKGQGAVLDQFAEDEIKTLVVHGRDLYIGINRQKSRRPRTGALAKRPSAAEFEETTAALAAQFGAPAEPSPRTGSARETPPEARLGNLLAGALYLRNANGRVDKLASWENEAILTMARDSDGGILVGMNGSARVYRVVSDQRWELLFDFDEQQALTLALRDGRLAFVGTGNVGNSYLIDAQKAPDGDYTTEVRDCKFQTTWGNILWLGTGSIAVSTRTGNTALPDATWSEWSDPLRESPSKIASPRARFIQLRAQLNRTSDPVLNSLSLYYQIQNQKPDISSVEIGDKPKPAEKPKTDTPAETAKPDAPSESRTKTANPTKNINWRAVDKDGDVLVFRLHYQARGDDGWIPVQQGKPVRKTEFAWDTGSVPDAWYRFKVIASDEESNPVGESLTDERISDLFKVDNRPPEVQQLAFDVATRTLTGITRDNLSLIRSLEYSLDGDEWQLMAAKDGVFDASTEAFSLQIEKPATGPHVIAVRATDEEGNIGVEKIAFQVK
jgi:hypothetical protein